MKKGFTLIELLAVILILGIIALIAIPTVNKIINEARYSSFKTSSDNIMKTAEQQCQTSLIKGENPVLSYLIDDSNVNYNLNIKGKMPEDGYILLNNNCSITKFYLKESKNIYSNSEDIRKDYMIKQAYEVEKSIFESLYPEQYANIISIEFIDNLNIPENAIEIKDPTISEKGKIKSWLIEDNENYKLYVGSNDTIYSNYDSKLLFYNLPFVKRINLLNFDTSFTTRLSSLFHKCEVLEEVDVSKFYTYNVTNFSTMFQGCLLLKNIDVSNWIMDNAINTTSMFYNCNSLLVLNLNNWKLNKVEKIERMFYGCSKLKEVNLSGFNVSKVVTLNRLFCNCTNLEKIIGYENWDVSKVKKMNMMFMGCKSLKYLDLSNWKTSSLIEFSEYEDSSTPNGSIFAHCSSLEYLNVTGWDTSKIERMVRVFDNCTKLTKIVGFETWDLSNVKNIYIMFRECNSLIELDLSNINFSNIENLDAFLYNCFNLTNIKINNSNDLNIVTNYLPDRTGNLTGNINLVGNSTGLDISNLNSKNWNVV